MIGSNPSFAIRQNKSDNTAGICHGLRCCGHPVVVAQLQQIQGRSRVPAYVQGYTATAGSLVIRSQLI